MTGLFPHAPSTPTSAPRFALPALEEDAPGVERLLGTLGRRALGVPAFSLGPAPLPLTSKLEEGVVVPHKELALLPDIGDLKVGSTGVGIFPSLDVGIFPSLDVGVYDSPPREPDDPFVSPSALQSAVDDWRAAADPVAGPSRLQVRQIRSLNRQTDHSRSPGTAMLRGC